MNYGDSDDRQAPIEFYSRALLLSSSHTHNSLTELLHDHQRREMSEITYPHKDTVDQLQCKSTQKKPRVYSYLQQTHKITSFKFDENQTSLMEVKLTYYVTDSSGLKIKYSWVRRRNIRLTANLISLKIIKSKIVSEIQQLIFDPPVAEH